MDRLTEALGAKAAGIASSSGQVVEAEVVVGNVVEAETLLGKLDQFDVAPARVAGRRP